MNAVRERLPNRRVNESFSLTADTDARNSAIAFSFAVQHGADAELIRRALCRDSQNRPNGPLAVGLDLILATSSAVSL